MVVSPRFHIRCKCVHENGNRSLRIGENRGLLKLLWKFHVLPQTLNMSIPKDNSPT